MFASYSGILGGHEKNVDLFAFYFVPRHVIFVRISVMNRSARRRCPFYGSSAVCFVAGTMRNSRAGRGNPFNILPQCFVQCLHVYMSRESTLVSGVTGRMSPNAALKFLEVGPGCRRTEADWGSQSRVASGM
jgi:hypothetical protein